MKKCKNIKKCIEFRDDIERDFIAACLAVSNLGMDCNLNKNNPNLLSVCYNNATIKNITGESVMSLFGHVCENDEQYDGAVEEWQSFIEILKKDNGLHESWNDLIPVINKYRELNAKE